MPQPTNEDQENQEPQESTMPIENVGISKIKGLSSEEVSSLLSSVIKEKVDRRPKWQKLADGIVDEEKELRKKYPIPQQMGPLRRTDNEMRCASRGCSSPTYYKFQGIPYCSTHVMRIMNEMLVAKGVLS
jgi:hypothetical protein